MTQKAPQTQANYDILMRFLDGRHFKAKNYDDFFGVLPLSSMSTVTEEGSGISAEDKLCIRCGLLPEILHKQCIGHVATFYHADGYHAFDITEDSTLGSSFTLPSSLYQRRQIKA